MHKNMMVLMGSVFAMSKLDLEAPVAVQMLRMGFLLSCMYCIIAYWWTFMVVEERKDRTAFEAKPEANGKPAVYMAKYDYDMQRLTDMVKGYMIWIIGVAFLHFNMKAVRPMFLTIMLTPINATENSLFKIHLLGFDDSEDGELGRPWPQDTLLTNLGIGVQKRRPPPAQGGGRGGARVEEIEGEDAEADAEEYLKVYKENALPPKAAAQ